MTARSTDRIEADRIFTLDRRSEIEIQNRIDRDLFSLKAVQNTMADQIDRLPPKNPLLGATLLFGGEPPNNNVDVTGILAGFRSTDSNSSPTACEYQLNRRVSLVLFLNGESSAAELNGYAGGSLTFYGLLKQPPWEKCGFNIQGETGLLVAFASDVYHEVTPVTEGMRFTMVTWFPLHQEMG